MLSEKFDEALQLACTLHRDQSRKGIAVPYISHLMAVAGIVLEANSTLNSPYIEDMAIGALLHDSIEDQGHQITLDNIEQRFGKRVREIVAGCTDSAPMAPDAPRPPWRDRKESYLASIPFKSKETQVVSCADKTHNLRCIMQDRRAIGEAIWDRFTADKEGVEWYYRSLYDAFSRAWHDNPVLPAFKHEIDKLTQI